MTTELLGQLAQIVSANQVLTTELGAYEQDWRQRERGRALCVVRPANTQEVAAVVRACAQAKQGGVDVSIVPQGGNTGLVMGSTPDATGRQVVLHLGRMRSIRALDVDNLSITAEAGCVLQSVQAAAREHGLLFPLSLAAEGSCTLGGNLATNAGGTQVLRYGNARELCLGLEVVTAQGEIWTGLGGLRKDNTGYDLRQLYIGSEGSLGIITAATMKLYPQPAAKVTAWACVPHIEAALALLRIAQKRLASDLTGFELMGNLGLQLVAAHMPQLRIPLWPGASQAAPYCVLLELSDPQGMDVARERLEAALGSAMEADCVHDAVVAENLAQASALWHVREAIPLAQAQEGLNIKHDISLPVSQIPAFVAAASADLQAALPGSRLVNFGHLGDGNLHFNVQCPVGADGPRFLATHEATANAVVYNQVLKAGGSISAEHGIGSLKRDTLAKTKHPVALALMHQIKTALDPLHLLNPGRVLQQVSPS